jgi:hypothetical protein
VSEHARRGPVSAQAWWSCAERRERAGGGGRAGRAGRYGARALLCAALLGAGTGAQLSAQDTIPPARAGAAPDTSRSAPSTVARAAPADPRPDRSVPASPVLSPQSWVFEALRRLWALGLLDEAFDAGTPALNCRKAARLLEAAAANARARRPELAPVAESYRVALESSAELCPGPGRPFGLALEGGYDRFRGGVRAGVGYDPADDWTGVRPLADTSTFVGRAHAALLLGRNLSLVATPEVRTGGVRLDEGYLALAAGPVAAWAGRRSFRFGPATAGGIVLSDLVALDGGGAYLAEPIRFPWVFRALGPIHMESFVSQVRGGDRIRNPYFVAFRGTMAPHPRLIVGLSRAAMFGGQGNLPITVRNMSFLFFGGTQSGPQGDFANDMVALDAQYRPPLGALPLVTFLEWGMDDAAGAWHHEPAFNAGAFLGSVPGLPWVGAGAEWTYFAKHDPQNTIWYRNFSLRNGWTDDGIGVGSPLGGNGRQALAHVDATLPHGLADLRADVFYRDRGPENLLAPERAGVSRGGALRLRVRPTGRVAAFGDIDVERGQGWTFLHLVTGIELALTPAGIPSSHP